MSIASVVELWNQAPAEIVEEEIRLIAACRDRDPDAFAQLVRLHERRVFRLAGRFFRHAEDVEDAAQETFLTVWRKIDTYRARAPFEHWLTRICLNCCYARLRKGREREVPVPVPETGTTTGNPDAGMDLEILLREIPPADRFILLLLDGEGWSVSEIADRLGWTAVNVRVRAHRARKRLRRWIERGGPR